MLHKPLQNAPTFSIRGFGLDHIDSLFGYAAVSRSGEMIICLEEAPGLIIFEALLS